MGNKSTAIDIPYLMWDQNIFIKQYNNTRG